MGPSEDQCRTIGDVINQVNEFFRTIAAVGEERSIATREIADNFSNGAAAETVAQAGNEPVWASYLHPRNSHASRARRS